MGYYPREIRVSGHRSAHNSIRDKTDQAKWEWLGDQIRALVERNATELESLSIEVDGPNDD